MKGVVSVNLSDGGHIENLAVYELLRRQCKFIVVADAGMEPKMECADLMRLQRYAAIDLGIRMHFDPTDLTLLPTSYSRAYAVLVKIDSRAAAGAGHGNDSRQLSAGCLLLLWPSPAPSRVTCSTTAAKPGLSTPDHG